MGEKNLYDHFTKSIHFQHFDMFMLNNTILIDHC